MSRLKELQMKQTSQRVTHSLTSELHEKFLTATNEIILLASSKSCSNAISTFDQLQTQTPYSCLLARMSMFSFFCVHSGKKGKKTHVPSFFSCALCRSKSLPQKKCDVLKCKKTRALPFFFLISVHCTPPKRVTYVERACILFFHHISSLCSSKRPAKKEWSTRSTCASLFFS